MSSDIALTSQLSPEHALYDVVYQDENGWQEVRIAERVIVYIHVCRRNNYHYFPYFIKLLAELIYFETLKIII